MLRITWLRISRRKVACRRRYQMVRAAGMMAIDRVISRRSQGRMRKLRKPSMTIWPAMVP